MIYYIVMSNGVPVDVTTKVWMAEASKAQFSTKNREAWIVPVVAQDFGEEEPTKPESENSQLELEFSKSNSE